MTSKTKKFRPSPALVIGCLALFMAMTGSALAIGKNTVRSPQIVNGAVKAADLGRNSVRSGKILNEGIYAADLHANSVRADEIAANAVGSDEVAEDAVGSEEIAPNAVGSDEVAPDSLTSGDLGAGSVGSSEVANGSLGKADLGSASVGSSELGDVTVRTNSQPLKVGANGAVTASCLGSEQMLSGGGQPGHYGVETTGSRPSGNGWRYLARNNTAATDSTITAYAVCLEL